MNVSLRAISANSCELVEEEEGERMAREDTCQNWLGGVNIISSPSSPNRNWQE